MEETLKIQYYLEMEIEITAPHLAFLEGDTVLANDIPIRVIRAARLRLGLIKAVPKPEQMHNWKSLDYKNAALDGSSNKYSVSVIENWRMDLYNDPERKQPGLTVIELRRSSDGQ